MTHIHDHNINHAHRRLFRYATARLFGPKAILNSIPKSGTHLLDRVFNFMPRMYGRQTVTEVRGEYPMVGNCDKLRSFFSTKQLERALKRVKRGQYFVAHMKHREDFSYFLNQMGFAHVLIIRDPRDVVVSFTQYAVNGMRGNNPMRPFYMDFANDEMRLNRTITGFEKQGKGGVFRVQGIQELYDGYLPWLRDPRCLVVRFEDLVGEGGGGDINEKLKTIQSISSFMGVRLSSTQIGSIADSIYATDSITFRKGRIGDWNNHFSMENRALFKKMAGKILIEWGYEKDLDW